MTAISPDAARTDADLPAASLALLTLLGDATRRRIFLHLLDAEACNCELAATLDLPQNLVSHHLRRLRQAGLLDEHREPGDGRWVHVTVDHEALREAWSGLDAALNPERRGALAPACHPRATAAPAPTA
ncbi:MAG: ArsR/SmtB family transcription factor [Acidimicrobiales bacterium]